MKKGFLFVSIVIIVFGIEISSYLKSNAAGWMWGGGAENDNDSPWDETNTNLGWVNMSCDSKVDSNGDGIVDSTDENLKICDEAGTDNDLKLCNGDGKISCTDAANCKSACDVLNARGINYGVSIPSSDGPVTGYAWSENIGWIQFDPTGPYPSDKCNPMPCPTGGVQRIENRLYGWARIVGIASESVLGNSGGWEGWIKMSGTAISGESYGVLINPATGELSGCTTGGTGCAWSDELGWIDFSRVKISTTDSLKICSECSAAVPPLNSITIIRGNSYSAKACLVSLSGNTCEGIEVTESTNWTSKDESVAIVDNSSEKGEITGKNVGEAGITATYNSLQEEVKVNVIEMPEPPKPVAPTPSSKYKEVTP